MQECKDKACAEKVIDKLWLALKMSSKKAASFVCVVLVAVVKSEDRISVNGLVPIDRCRDSVIDIEHFACKLDDCAEWIFFTNCPENVVSTRELNIVTKCLNCKKRNSTNSNDLYQGLFPKSMCSHILSQGEITWCQIEKCWFPFMGCAEDEIPTEYLNLKEKTLVCRNKATSNPGNYIVPAPTTEQQTSTPHSHSGRNQFKPVLSFFLLLVVFSLPLVKPLKLLFC